MTEYEELKKLADSFFDWPTEDRTHVTTTSAILFAQYVLAAAPQQAAEPVAAVSAADYAYAANTEAEPIGHVWPDDLKRLETTECRVDCYSVPMGRADGAKTVPLYSHPPAQPQGEAVVTWNESKTQILAVTRQDADGLILSVIAEAPAQPPAQPEQPATQYGWLIENGSNTQTMYRCINNDTGMSIEWTPDANKALRFARREDAQAFAYHDEDAARIAEHAWIAGLTRPAAPGGE